jgi:hypothetical protein
LLELWQLYWETNVPSKITLTRGWMNFKLYSNLSYMKKPKLN